MSLSSCLAKAGDIIKAKDRDDLLKRQQAHRAAGLSVADAERAALDAAIAEAESASVSAERGLVGGAILNIGLDVGGTSKLTVDEVLAAIAERGGDVATYIAFASNRPESEAFKKWFGDSKAVDDEGKPLVVYHGTAARDIFDAFDSKRLGDNTDHWTARLGFFFQSDPYETQPYSAPMGLDAGDAPARTIPVHLSIQTPYTMSAEEFGHHIEEGTGKSIRKLRRDLIKGGYDGVVVYADDESMFEELNVGDTWVAFYPEQIKSIFNRDASGGAQFASNSSKTRSELVDRISRDGITGNDLQALLSSGPGFSMLAKSAIARDLDAATDLRQRLIDEYGSSDWKAPKLHIDQGVVGLDAGWLFRDTLVLRPQIERLIDIVGDDQAPITIRGFVGRDIEEELYDSGFERYLGIGEAPHRIQYIKPGGGITAGTPLFASNEDFSLQNIRPPRPPGPPTRETGGWLISRDELGRFRFGAGAKLYDAVARVAKLLGDKINFAMPSKELGRALRQMRTEVNNSLERMAPVAAEMAKLGKDDRSIISDIIEGELKRGVKPTAEVIKTAEMIGGLMERQTDELVSLGMLSPEAANEWRGRYLPRFYAKKLGGSPGELWERAMRVVGMKTAAMAGIRGSSLHRRGMTEVIDASLLPKYQAEGWKVDDKSFIPGVHRKVTVHRDFTRQEREGMGEIRDAAFRFVMGYSQSQRDIALGRLFQHLAETVASRTEVPGYVKVPETIIDGTDVTRYGKLSGMWVPTEVLDHIRASTEQHGAAMRAYLKALSMWKEGKTVLNPVSHINNIVSNLTMAHFAGISYWRADQYAAAMRDLMFGSKAAREAQEAGLFGGTMTVAEVKQMLPKEFEVLAKTQTPTSVKSVDWVWNAMALFMRRPAQAAYRAEDLFFKYMLYRYARGRGLHPNDAVDYATRYIFEYDDLPGTAQAIRNFGLPFFSYTYKVIPVLLHTALQHPLRFAAPTAALAGVHHAMYALALAGEAGEDDWYKAIIDGFTNAERAAAIKERKAQEHSLLPRWQQGRTSIGTQKSIRLGTDEKTGSPVFIDTARMIPGGDILEMENNSNGIPIPQPLMPSHPLFSTASALLLNKDMFYGREVVDENDTTGEKSRKYADWLWKQWMPAITYNGYHYDRLMNAAAAWRGETIPDLIVDHTGVGKDGLPVQPKYALMQSAGIKARPIDLEHSAKMLENEKRKLIRGLRAEIKRLRQLESRGAMSERQAGDRIAEQEEKIDRLRQGLTVDGDEKE